MRLFVPMLAIAIAALVFCSARMIRLTVAAIGVVLLLGVLGLWSVCRQ